MSFEIGIAALRNLSWRRAALLAAATGAVILAGFFLRTAWLEDRLLRADPGRIAADPVLLAFGVRHGSSIFAARCASCHGRDGRGDRQTGVPDLADSDWLYGAGATDEIEKTVTYGIRAHNSRTWNLAEMPAFARARPSRMNPDVPPLSPADIRDLAELLLSVEGHAADHDARQRGEKIFLGRGGCSDCHGSDARGDASIGAPNLADAVWLRGDGSRRAIYRTIARGMAGTCPSWAGRLSPAAIREVSLFVHGLARRPPSPKAD